MFTISFDHNLTNKKNFFTFVMPCEYVFAEFEQVFSTWSYTKNFKILEYFKFSMFR